MLNFYHLNDKIIRKLYIFSFIVFLDFNDNVTTKHFLLKSSNYCFIALSYFKFKFSN